MSEDLSNLFRLDQKHVVVIGEGSGIGRAIAMGVSAHGASVSCWDVDLEAAQEPEQAISWSGGEAQSAEIDVSSRESVKHGFADLEDPPSGVVATPGVNVRKPLLDYDEAELAKVIDVNLKGAFWVLQQAGALMAKHGKGSIVLLSSIRSQVVEPGQSVYAATKAGIVQMMRTAAAELGPSGVRVNAIAPGVVETPLTAPIKNQPEWYEAYRTKSALGRWARAEEMAGAAVYLLSPASSYTTGSVLFVDGGWTAVAGRFDPPGM